MLRIPYKNESGCLSPIIFDKESQMKIYVCVKHVPDTAATIKVVGEADFDRTVKFVMNPYDEYAVE